MTRRPAVAAGRAHPLVLIVQQGLDAVQRIGLLLPGGGGFIVVAGRCQGGDLDIDIPALRVCLPEEVRLAVAMKSRRSGDGGEEPKHVGA